MLTQIELPTKGQYGRRALGAALRDAPPFRDKQPALTGGQIHHVSDLMRRQINAVNLVSKFPGQSHSHCTFVISNACA